MKCRVTCCKDCPFFGGVPLLAGLSKLLDADTAFEKVGVCNYDVASEVLVEIKIGLKGEARDAMIAKARSRPAISDNTKMPELCPLRQGDIAITIAAKEN